MSVQKIEQQYNPAAVFLDSFWIMILLSMGGLIIFNKQNMNPIIFILPVLVISVTVIFWQSHIARILKHRRETLTLMGAKSQAAGAMQQGTYNFFISSLHDKERVRNKRFENYVHGKDWGYADFSYEYVRKTKYGTYRHRTVYYSVMTTKLGRRLPHVFFDSRKARRRQFRYFFSSAQIQSLEGNFDKHFVTYFPSDYHIDGRSLITPEVMEALIAADEYDIEIIGDQLFLIGNLKDPELQLPDMEAKLLNIKKKLHNNSITYRDENLPYAMGRQNVTPLGAQLAMNLTVSYVLLAGGLLMIIAALTLSIITGYTGEFVIWLIIFGISFILESARKIIKELRNRKRVRNYHKSSLTTPSV
jgi:hypothetical protein